MVHVKCIGAAPQNTEIAYAVAKINFVFTVLIIARHVTKDLSATNASTLKNTDAYDYQRQFPNISHSQ